MVLEVPKAFRGEEELDAYLVVPYPATVDLMKRLEGDVMIVGVGGKVGPSLARTALNACREAGVRKRVYGVDLFPQEEVRQRIQALGVETIACDLLDPKAVDRLPRVRNILYLAGRKFGEVGSEFLTWMINVVAAENVARTFQDSSLVAFSTGCVYALVSPEGGGSVETDRPMPVGEYANSCLGRERIFEYYAERGTLRVLLFRLNYSVELRYGVLVDIAQKVYNGQPVERSVAAVNVLWQGDTVNRALLCLGHVACPAAALNITGGEILSVTGLAERFGKLFGKPVCYRGEDAGKAYLANAAESIRLLGPPRVHPDTIMPWVAEWIKSGGRQLGKPTHFQVTDGQFLD